MQEHQSTFKQTLKGEREKPTYRDINTPLSTFDKTTRLKISRDIEELYDTTTHQDLIGIYRALHPTNSSVHILVH